MQVGVEGAQARGMRVGQVFQVLRDQCMTQRAASYETHRRAAFALELAEGPEESNAVVGYPAKDRCVTCNTAITCSLRRICAENVL